jgi:hypothetical protein
LQGEPAIVTVADPAQTAGTLCAQTSAKLNTMANNDFTERVKY